MADREGYEVLKFLHSIQDPRIERCKKHSLESILFLTLTGMLCGADSAREIVEFADANETWIQEYVELKEGIPSHDTITRVFSLIDKNIFCESFTKWTKNFAENNR